MKILITGGAGMLGRTLFRHLSTSSMPSAAHEVVPLDRQALDIGRPDQVRRVVRETKPDVILHAAAMTKVDLCETERDEAFRGNALGSANIAAAATDVGARLIAFSTDYVFSGSLDRPYHEWDAVAPKTVYGQSKLAAEVAIRQHAPNHLILRIAWLYGPGGPSFVHTMLTLGAKTDGAALRVVDDQRGNPTSTDAVAQAVTTLLDVPLVGTAHLTCEGEATWFEFTQEIFRLRGFSRGVEPCTTQDYPRPAPRPANSRLDNRVLRLSGLPAMPDWQASVASFLKEYPYG
ncbi:MAG: dTDP-4-dehydrorhamnose reductase [Deltaproteobacteria bacterium]|nr:dTDP-4-dehydrorhamnose reductase [Deltaproteobacteria bacterium]